MLLGWGSRDMWERTASLRRTKQTKFHCIEQSGGQAIGGLPSEFIDYLPRYLGRLEVGILRRRGHRPGWVHEAGGHNLIRFAFLWICLQLSLKIGPMPLNSFKHFFESNLQGETSYITLHFPLPPFACYCNFDPNYPMRGSLSLYKDDLARRCDQEVQSTPTGDSVWTSSGSMAHE